MCQDVCDNNSGQTVSADCKLLATVGGSGTVRIWDLATGQKLLEIALAPTGAAKDTHWGAEFAPDNRHLVVFTVGGGQVYFLRLAPPPTKAQLPTPLIQSPEPRPFVKLPGKDYYTNAIGMHFVKVPAGTSWLGGRAGKPGDQQVKIDQDFYLGVFEVTQAQWQAVMGNNPSAFSRTGGSKDTVKDIPDAVLAQFPVEQVSWDDCQEFIKRLNEQDKAAGWEYRLPTEVEWEYACRGGPMPDKAESAFDYYLGEPSNTLLPAQANFQDSDLKRTCEVGSYVPNRLGLYDMHGNVQEWCQDLFEPQKPPRVRRGGSWRNSLSAEIRAAYRIGYAPSNHLNYLGLRLARVPVEAK